MAVERWTLSLAALVIGGATLVAPRSMAWGATVGAGLATANAVALRRIGERLLKSARGTAPGAVVLLFNLKMLVLAGLVFLIVHYLRVHTAGFLVGISVFPVAIVAAAIDAGWKNEGNVEESNG